MQVLYLTIFIEDINIFHSYRAKINSHYIMTIYNQKSLHHKD